MNVTEVSLLQRAQNGEGAAWDRLNTLYRPLIFNWLRSHSVEHHTAEDLTQQVLEVVVKELPHFRHAGRPGAFRNWLRLITSHKARAFWKANRLRAAGQGFSDLITQLEDPASKVSDIWNREHDRYILRRLLEDVRREFSPTTMEAFRLQALEGVSAAETARRLGLSVGAVYVARSRVTRRLRDEASGLID